MDNLTLAKPGSLQVHSKLPDPARLDKNKKTERAVNFVVYMSARRTIPQFQNEAVRLGQLIGLNKDNLIWGGADAGSMGDVPLHAFINGATTLAVPHTGLIEIEGKSAYASWNAEASNFLRRIWQMQDCGDAVVVLPGGYGSLQEFFHALQAMECGIVPKMPIVFVSPDIGDGQSYYDYLFKYLKNQVERGYLRPWVMEYVLKVPSAEQAYWTVRNYVEALPEKSWRENKQNQIIHTAEHNGMHHFDGVQRKLIHELEITTDPHLVAVVGSNRGSSFNEMNNDIIKSIPGLIASIKSQGKKIVCVNSNRGTSSLILNAAIAQGALELAVDSPSCEDRVVENRRIPIARFKTPEQMNGFMMRYCAQSYCLPGSFVYLSDLLCEISVASRKFMKHEVVIPNLSGENDFLFKQLLVMQEPRFALRRDGSTIGLASKNVVEQCFVPTTQTNLEDIPYLISRGRGLRNHESPHDVHIPPQREGSGYDLKISKPEAQATLRLALNGEHYCQSGDTRHMRVVRAAIEKADQYRVALRARSQLVRA